MSHIESPKPGLGLRSRGRLASALALLMLTVGLAYWPGLSGPFILDDSNNIAPLGDGGGIQNSDDFWDYVLGGGAGPMGRPLSLASFAANAQQWPADPWGFKVTNLGIHLLNSILVFVLARLLLVRAQSSRPATTAFLVTALWALHPLQVSTVLYVVQRMTELATLFTLAGLILFIRGRDLAISRPKAGYALIAVGIGVGGLLATLSKESGILLPLYALTLEFLVLRRSGAEAPRHWSMIGGLLLLLPVMGLAIYPILKLPEFIQTYSTLRQFTAWERVLTQGPVLLDYLSQLAVPRLSGTGVFHDDFPLSKGLLNPPTTLLAWAALIFLIGMAVRVRRNQPLLSLGVLWFFAGHSLEASFIPLELYFEHRNYLPAFGLALIAAHYAVIFGKRFPLAAYGALGLFLVAEVLITRNQALVWGDERLAAEIWSREHPDSLRAQLYVSHYWNSRGEYARGLGAFERAAELHADSATARLHVMELRCRQGVAVDPYVLSALPILRKGSFDMAAPDSLARTQKLLAQGRCRGLTSPVLMQAIEAYASNPVVVAQPRQRYYLSFIRASALAAEGRYHDAAAEMDAAAARGGGTLIDGYWQAVWMIEAEDAEEARRYYALARDQHAMQFGSDSELDQQLIDLGQQVRQLTVRSIRGGVTSGATNVD